MDDVYLEVLTIVGIIATIIGSGIGIFKSIYWYQDRKPAFAYEKFKERDMWYLRIQHNDKIIHKLSITMNNSLLPLSDKKDKYERVMRINEGQNFEIGKEVNPSSEIVIRYDRYKIKKIFSDIPLAKDSE
ncbi:MAG: hypothetical protein KGL95_07120 [Patescibacteria group bacterium]|nr:hypothetical protein [Patescibacteria group bacterium]